MEEGGCPQTEAASLRRAVLIIDEEGTFLMILPCPLTHRCIVRSNGGASRSKIYCFHRNRYLQLQGRCNCRNKYCYDCICALKYLSHQQRQDRSSSLLSFASNTPLATLPCSKPTMRRALDAVIRKSKSTRAAGAPLVPLVGALGLLGTMASLLRSVPSLHPLVSQCGLFL